jgi:hypothetical protein
LFGSNRKVRRVSVQVVHPQVLVITRDAGKKYFDLLDLAVVWDVPDSDAILDYDVVKLDKSNWIDREYFAVTHILKHAGTNHVVNVISVQDALLQIDTLTT